MFISLYWDADWDISLDDATSIAQHSIREDTLFCILIAKCNIVSIRYRVQLVDI